MAGPSLTQSEGPQALREAARLDAEGKCGEAERYYRQALASARPSPSLLNNAGNHYLLCGQPETARSYFEQLLRADPGHANANLQLARLAVNRKEGTTALKHLARLDQADQAVRLVRAEALHWTGKRNEAMALLQDLEKRAGKDARAFLAVGMVYARIGLYDRAEAAFQAALAIRPSDFDILLNLGRAAARAGHFDRARNTLGVALKVRPEDTDALFELGLAEAAARDYNRAVYMLAQARQKAPQRPDILLALARAAEDAGFYGDSAVAYDEYLRIRPGDDAVRRDRARVRGYSGDRLAEAFEELDWYVREHPTDPIGHYNLAQFSWRTDPDKSLAQLATALRLDPEFAPAHVSRAWLLNRLGRPAEAVPHLQAATKISPDNVRALDLFGLVYIALDRPADAEEVLRRALAASPEDPEVLLHLGRALAALGREEEAQRFVEQYQQVRPRRARDPRKEAGMIELATLPAGEQRQREIERFRRMSRSRPDDPVLHLHLAGLLLSDGRVKEAVEEFRGLLDLNADPRVWEEAGKVLVRAELYELAADFLRRAAAGRPGARLDLSIALLHTTGPAAALQVLEEVPDGERDGDFWLLKARILDASGRAEEAQGLLTEGLRRSSLRPQVVQGAALLLCRRGRAKDALDLLDRAAGSTADNPEMILTRAAVLALLHEDSTAERVLKEVQSRWPEWDRSYLAYGLLLERAARMDEAAQMLRTAVILGSTDPAAKCALARLSASALSEPACSCQRGLEDWIFGTCPSR